MRPAILPGDITKGYAFQGRYSPVVTSGAVTLIAARSTTAGEIFTLRWPSAAASMYVRYVGARFRVTTAFAAAQEVGCDLILAHAYTVNGTDGTAVDLGTTIDDTGALLSTFTDSLLTAGCCRVAGAAAITAGTRTLDAHPIGLVSNMVSGIGDTMPDVGGYYYPLFDVRGKSDALPIQLNANQGLSIRNTILMGAVGVGRWEFEIEWDEGVPLS